MNDFAETEVAGEGHNSDGAENAAVSQLRSYFERIERLEEEKKTLAEDVKEVFGEAKAHGFDVKAMREVLRTRKKDQDVAADDKDMADQYYRALGMDFML